VFSISTPIPTHHLLSRVISLSVLHESVILNPVRGKEPPPTRRETLRFAQSDPGFVIYWLSGWSKNEIYLL